MSEAHGHQLGPSCLHLKEVVLTLETRQRSIVVTIFGHELDMSVVMPPSCTKGASTYADHQILVLQ